MKIAIIGGGIFGLTAAIRLSEDGHMVTVFEREPEVMMAASLVNQGRLHKGYHYPRSPETIEECLRSEESFRRMYGEAVIDSGEQLYGIARVGSMVSAQTFQAVLDKYGLPYEVLNSDVVDTSSVQACFRVQEGRIDALRLRNIVKARAKNAGVHIISGKAVRVGDLKDAFDYVVVASYANMNEALGSAATERSYQFEVVEKPVVSLPSAFGDRSVVIMDGPFMCVDPFHREGRYLFGNVAHAIHATNIGTHPVVPAHIAPVLNKGIVSADDITKFPLYKESGSRFIPMLADAQHHGSLFTIGTVLPKKEDTDERLTIVSHVQDRVSTIFAGKFSNCVEAADQIVGRVRTL